MTDGSHFEPLMSCPLAVQPVLYIAGVHFAGHAERTPEGASPHGEVVALECRMQPRTPARKHSRSICDNVGILDDDPQQGGPRGTRTASDARSDGFHPTPLRCAPADAGGPPQFYSRIESGWMSIFAPVSFAARRAFWPSLPIASESW